MNSWEDFKNVCWDFYTNLYKDFIYYLVRLKIIKSLILNIQAKIRKTKN